MHLSVSSCHLKTASSLLSMAASSLLNLGMNALGSWFVARLVNTFTKGILLSLRSVESHLIYAGS